MTTRRHHSWVDVAVFENINDGRILETLLRGKEIEARTYHNKWLQAFLFLRPPHVTWRVQVRHDDYAAVQSLFESSHPPILEKAVHCPSCGSLHVNYPQMTRKFFLPTVALHAGIIFRLLGHECYCEHCHMNWTYEYDVDHKVRVPRPFFPFK
ncbi:MAG TPA: hypothetical protein VK811_09480 [Candidatus Acidoferrum sp.]|jgi:hypothetical protein|nr:hypothetical protein [Candidatus Acidoferrum sp.]